MKSIAVCPLSKLDITLKNTGAERLISLLSGDTAFERPSAIARENHLLLRFNDISTPRDGLVLPSRQNVEDIIKFAQLSDWTTPVLVHCWAGISRSPAAAAIIALALNPGRDEVELAANLRELSASATPNIKLIETADEVLGRGGRFLAAITRIGRGADAFEGTPFVFPLRL